MFWAECKIQPARQVVMTLIILFLVSAGSHGKLASVVGIGGGDHFNQRLVLVVDGEIRFDFPLPIATTASG